MLSRRNVVHTLASLMNSPIWKSDVPKTGKFYLFYDYELGRHICSINIDDFLPIVEEDLIHIKNVNFDIKNQTLYLLNGIGNRAKFNNIQELFTFLRIS